MYLLPSDIKKNTIFSSDSIAGIYLEWVYDYDPIFKAYEQSLSYWKLKVKNRPSISTLSNFFIADLRQDINRVSSFSRCHNGTFP